MMKSNYYQIPGDNVFKIKLKKGWNDIIIRTMVKDFWSRMFIKLMDDKEMPLVGIEIDPNGK
jgi:hypothetical protein